MFGEACNFFEKSGCSSQHLRAAFAQLAVCVSLEKDRIVSFELFGFFQYSFQHCWCSLHNLCKEEYGVLGVQFDTAVCMGCLENSVSGVVKTIITFVEEFMSVITGNRRCCRGKGLFSLPLALCRSRLLKSYSL